VSQDLLSPGLGLPGNAPTPTVIAPRHIPPLSQSQPTPPFYATAGCPTLVTDAPETVSCLAMSSLEQLERFQFGQIDEFFAVRFIVFTLSGLPL
jgi:hypothetical protein